MKVYVASSWKNQHQQNIVQTLREHGFECYDFQNPKDSTGFHWSQVGINSAGESEPETYLRGLIHPIAEAGFNSDFGAMKNADAGILVLPAGRSAHLEIGWMAGQGKPTAILLYERPIIPDLMVKMCSLITPELSDVLEWLTSLRPVNLYPNCHLCLNPMDKTLLTSKQITELCSTHYDALRRTYLPRFIGYLP